MSLKDRASLVNNWVCNTSVTSNRSWKGRIIMKKNRLIRLSKVLEMPEEIISTVPKVTTLGFEKLLVENYKNILEYQDFFIRINTSIGIININGMGLKMGEMTTDDIVIEGKIDSIDFEEIES